MLYRKEIDGLRAIAVLPVILFHGGFLGFSGGYVGVDIFFVISGYLITSIILEEKKEGRFSIINFYERRARRILPALSIVLVFTSVMAFLLMPADLLKSYSQSLVSVTSFSSNVFFYLTNNYFSTASDEMPLLHTWSLAVEEQYYLFFPLMVVLTWSLGKKWLLSTIILIALLSLACAHYLSLQNATNANFYLIFSRAWELFFGSGLAFVSLKQLRASKGTSEFMGFLGFSMIAYSIVTFDRQTPFPSLYTLVPVVGTCLIIAFSSARSYLGRLLSNKILVLIGLLSYSLYLWHQPLFAFLRMKSIGEPPIYMFLWAILVTFLMSYLSWQYVEKPFRNKVTFNRTTIFRYSIASIAAFLSIGLVGHLNNGFEQRYTYKTYSDSIAHSPKRDECHTKGHDYLRPSEACTYFGSNVTWASFGDSHTVEPAYALAKSLQPHDIGLVHLSFSGCPPSILFEVKLPGCTKWIRESIQFLEENKSITNVMLGFRYSAYLFGGQLDPYPHIPDKDPSFTFVDSANAMTKEKSRELYWRSFENIINRLLDSGKNVYVLYPIPELPVDISKAVMPFSIFGDKTTLDLRKSTSAGYYFSRNNFILGKLDSMTYGTRLQAIKPFEVICDSGFCPSVVEQKAIYFDDNHLSISGAQLLIQSSNIKIESIEPNFSSL